MHVDCVLLCIVHVRMWPRLENCLSSKSRLRQCGSNKSLAIAPAHLVRMKKRQNFAKTRRSDLVSSPEAQAQMRALALAQRASNSSGESVNDYLH